MSYYTQPSDKPGHVKASYFIIFLSVFSFPMMILEQKNSERNKRIFSLLFKIVWYNNIGLDKFGEWSSLLNRNKQYFTTQMYHVKILKFFLF